MHDLSHRRFELAGACGGRATGGVSYAVHRWTAGPPEVSVLLAAGELDMDSTPVLRRAIRGALRPGGHLVVELSAVRFLGAAAIGLFMELDRLAEGLGAELHLLARPEARVHRLLRDVQVPGVPPVHAEPVLVWARVHLPGPLPSLPPLPPLVAQPPAAPSDP